MNWKYVLYGALVLSAYIIVKIALGYSWDTHLVALISTWLVAGIFIHRFRKQEALKDSRE